MIYWKRQKSRRYQFWQKLIEEVPKKKRKSLQPKYSNTKIKARNFLTNLSYQRLNKNKHLNVSFVIECFSFITENLNPNSLQRKFTYKRNKKIHLLVVEKIHS